MKDYHSHNFHVNFEQKADRVVLAQEVFNPALYTEDLPCTLAVLEKRIPTIFTNHCRNGKGYTFKREAKNTEVGHLFEHLILENLKLLALKKRKTADYRGVTSWDWSNNRRGSFDIVVYSGKKDKKLFSIAFAKSVRIMEEIFGIKQRAGGFPLRSLHSGIKAS